MICLLNYLSWDYVQIEIKKNKVKCQRQIVITCVESAQGMDGIALMRIHVIIKLSRTYIYKDIFVNKIRSPGGEKENRTTAAEKTRLHFRAKGRFQITV